MTQNREGGQRDQARGSRRCWGEAAAAAPADGEQGGGGALGSRAQSRGGGAARGAAQRRWRRRAVAPAAALGQGRRRRACAGGGGATRGEQQRARAGLVRAQTGREAARAGRSACGGGDAVRPTAAWSRTSVETSRTRRNVESMSTSGSPKVDLSCWAKRTGTGGRSSTAEWSSGGFNGWRPEKLRFPAIWSMRLAKEGSRRKLGRLSSFGCGGFEIRGAELTDSAGDSELAHSLSMATTGEGRKELRRGRQ